jgi:hypothetical protein
MWLTMMPGSRKSADLVRNSWFAIHSASADKNVSEGDAKLSGRALPVTDGETWRLYIEASGSESEPGGFDLFRVDVTEISHLIPAGDHLDIEWWSEASGYKQVARY